MKIDIPKLVFSSAIGFFVATGMGVGITLFIANIWDTYLFSPFFWFIAVDFAVVLYFD